jgi:hypothetical protein
MSSGLQQQGHQTKEKEAPISLLLKAAFETLYTLMLGSTTNQLMVADEFKMLLEFIPFGDAVIRLIHCMLATREVQESVFAENSDPFQKLIGTESELNTTLLQLCSVFCLCNGVAVQENQIQLGEKVVGQKSLVWISLQTRGDIKRVVFHFPETGDEDADAISSPSADQEAFLTAQTILFAKICMQRNYLNVKKVREWMGMEACLMCMANKELATDLRAAFAMLCHAVYIDVEPLLPQRWGDNCVLLDNGDGFVNSQTAGSAAGRNSIGAGHAGSVRRRSVKETMVSGMQTMVKPMVDVASTALDLVEPIVREASVQASAGIGKGAAVVKHGANAVNNARLRVATALPTAISGPPSNSVSGLEFVDGQLNELVEMDARKMKLSIDAKYDIHIHTLQTMVQTSLKVHGYSKFTTQLAGILYSLVNFGVYNALPSSTPDPARSLKTVLDILSQGMLAEWAGNISVAAVANVYLTTTSRMSPSHKQGAAGKIFPTDVDTHDEDGDGYPRRGSFVFGGAVEKGHRRLIQCFFSVESRKKTLRFLDHQHTMISIVGLVLAALIISQIAEFTGSTHPFFKGFDYACYGVFVVELLLRIWAMQDFKGFFSNAYCIVDLLVVVIDTITFVFSTLFKDNKGYSKLLRLFRLVRLVRLLKLMRLLHRLKMTWELNRKEAQWFLPEEYRQLDPKKLEAMTASAKTMGLVIAHAGKIRQRALVSELTKPHYVMHDTDDVDVLRGWGVDVMQLTTAVMHLVLYEHGPLNQAAVELLMTIYTAQDSLVKSAQSSFFLCTSKDQEMYFQLEQEINQITLMMDKLEIHLSETPEQQMAFVGTVTRLLAFCKRACESYNVGWCLGSVQKFKTNKDAQTILQNLELVPAYERWREALDVVVDQKEWLGLYEAMNGLLVSFVRLNLSNATEVFTALQPLLTHDMIAGVPGAAAVLHEMLRDNPALVRMLPHRFFHKLLGHLEVEDAKIDPDSEVLQVMKAIMETVMDDDAIEIEVITTLSKYECTSPSLDFFHELLQDKPMDWPVHKGTSTSTSDISHLDCKLQFKLIAFEVMTLCTAGTCSNHVEGLLQKTLQWEEILVLLADPNTPPEIAYRVGTVFFEVFIAVQVPVKGVCAHAQMWQLISSFERNLHHTISLMPKAYKSLQHSALGKDTSEDTSEDFDLAEAFEIRMGIMNTFECILPAISHFIKIYLLPRHKPLTQERVTRMRQVQIVCKELERVCNHKCAPDYLKVVVMETTTSLDRLLRRYSTVESPDIFRRAMLRARKRLDNGNKTAIGTKRGLMKSIEEHGYVAIVHRYSLDDIQPVEALVNKSSQPSRAEMHKRLVDNLQMLLSREISIGRSTRDSGVKKLAHFMTKHLPSVADRVDESRKMRVGILRFEPLVQKLVTHTRGKLSAKLNHKTLHQNDQKVVLFTFQLLRTMIENAWGFGIDQRNDDQYDHDKADAKAQPLHHDFNAANVPQMCVDFIAKGLDKKICTEAMSLLIAMLYQEGGNLMVQQQVNDYLVVINSELFFKAARSILRAMMSSFSITEEHRTHQGVSGYLSKDGDLTTGLKMIHTLQLLCEGHFVPNQLIISLQSGHNASSTNILDDVATHLCTLCDKVVQMAAKADPTKKKIDEGVDQEGEGSLVSIRKDTLQTVLEVTYKLTCLVLELIQGPCERNIEYLALNTELLEHMNDFVCAELNDHEMMKTLKAQMLRTLKGVLEGQSDKHPSMVYERMLSCLHLESLKLFVYPPELNFADESVDLVQAIEDRDRQERTPLDAIQIESLVLLQMLTQYSPDLQDELQLQLGESSAFRDEVSAVEVVWGGNNQKHYFRRPTMCKRLSLKMKNDFQEHVDRFDQESKLRDFISRSRLMYEELKWMEYLQHKGIAMVFNEDLQDFFTWVLFFVNLSVNLVFIIALSWQEATDEEGADISNNTSARQLFGGKVASKLVDESYVAAEDAHIVNRHEDVLIALHSVETIVCCCTLILILVVTVRVALRKLMREVRRQYLRIYHGQSTAFDTWSFVCESIRALDPHIIEAIFYCIYLGSAVATPNNPLVSAICFLTQLIMKFEMCQAVLMSVWVPLNELVVTGVLVVLTLYIFAVAIFENLREAVPNGGCDTLASCLRVLANNGLRNGGGIGDYLYENVHDGSHKYILELCFFLLVIIILMNIIFGLIIDTFSTLREEKKERQRDIAQICFICGVDKSQFDLTIGGDFHHHVREEHNTWEYFSFMVFIWEQDRDDDDGLEKEVRSALNGDVCLLSWFPRGQTQKEASDAGEGSGAEATEKLSKK